MRIARCLGLGTESPLFVRPTFTVPPRRSPFEPLPQLIEVLSIAHISVQLHQIALRMTSVLVQSHGGRVIEIRSRDGDRKFHSGVEIGRGVWFHDRGSVVGLGKLVVLVAQIPVDPGFYVPEIPRLRFVLTVNDSPDIRKA